MLADRSGYCDIQFGLTGPHPSSSQASEAPRLAFSFSHGVQDHARSLFHDIGDHLPSRALHPLPRLLNAMDRSLRGGRENARFPQAIAQQFGHPDGIFGVRLASRHSFEVLSIDHQDLHLALEHVAHRFPIPPVSSRAIQRTPGVCTTNSFFDRTASRETPRGHRAASPAFDGFIHAHG